MNEKKTRKLHISGDKLVLICAIIAVFILFTALNKNFLSFQNIVNILVAASLVLCTASLVDASYNPFLYFRF